MTLPWRVETATGPARRLLEPPPSTERTIRVILPEDTAVVIGSTQPESHIDAARATAAGWAVVRRRSGGGAVLVGPGRLLWVDVVVPAGDPLWTADVGHAFWWLGGVWAAALAAAGLAGGRVWRGGLVRSRWSDRVCFAGLGPGEVTVAGAKVVGLAQRRTRARIQFQCAVLIAWNPSDLLAVLDLEPENRTAAASELMDAARGVGDDVSSKLLPAFLDSLP